MKVAVLGGNGFLGSKICNKLLEKEHTVISFDRDPSKISSNDRFVSVSGDFFDDSDLFRVVESADCIVHAICTVSTNNCQEQFLRGYQNDFLQTVKLFDYAARNGKRTIFLSSGGTVYGNPKIIPTPEEAPTEPISHYGVLKRSIENVAAVFNDNYGNHIISARISNPYGPGQDYKKGIGFIDAVLRNAIAHETVTIWGSGDIVRDYIFIDDVTDILTHFMENDMKYTVVNVGTGIGTSQNEIIEVIRNMGVDVTVQHTDARGFDVKRNILDNTRLKEVHSHELVPIASGIRMHYEYLLHANEGRD